jgi:hypothetical protein
MTKLKEIHLTDVFDSLTDIFFPQPILCPHGSSHVYDTQQHFMFLLVQSIIRRLFSSSIIVLSPVLSSEDENEDLDYVPVPCPGNGDPETPQRAPDAGTRFISR